MMWWDIVLSGRVMVVDKSSRGESKVNERKENIGEGSNSYSTIGRELPLTILVGAPDRGALTA